MTKSKKIKVLVADDRVHEVEGFASIIGAEADMEVVGTAETEFEVLEKSKSADPDIILLDLMWFGDKEVGLNLIPQLKREVEKLKIIAVTNYPNLLPEARARGAYPLEKGFTKARLLNAIRLVHYQEQPTVEDIKQSVKRFNSNPLTKREQEILQLIIRGYKDAAIAPVLHITTGTVKKHVGNILAKLDAQNRTEAAFLAQANNFLDT